MEILFFLLKGLAVLAVVAALVRLVFKQNCKTCLGYGRLYTAEYVDEGENKGFKCPTCGGRGKVWRIS